MRTALAELGARCHGDRRPDCPILDDLGRLQIFPAQMHDHHGLVGVYFEVASAIIALVLLGEWLELGARGRTSAAIRQLLGLAPKSARRVNADGTEEDVPLGHIHAGARLRVRPGEKMDFARPPAPTQII